MEWGVIAQGSIDRIGVVEVFAGESFVARVHRAESLDSIGSLHCPGRERLAPSTMTIPLGGIIRIRIERQNDGLSRRPRLVTPCVSRAAVNPE